MENILDDLIKEGEELKGTLQVPPNVVYTYYKSTKDSEYQTWIANIRRFLKLNYSEDLNEFNQLTENIWPSDHDKIIGILEAIQRLPQQPKETKKEAGISITNNLSQSQTQSQEVAINIFIESIEEHLSMKQFKEIKEIVAEHQDKPEEAKSKIMDKLKSFGGDVLSNIVANIITNPAIYSGLI